MGVKSAGPRWATGTAQRSPGTRKACRHRPPGRRGAIVGGPLPLCQPPCVSRPQNPVSKRGQADLTDWPDRVMELLMRKTKSKSKTAKKRSLRKKAAAPASTRKAKKIAKRVTRKGYDAQMGRPTGRDATALARLDERTKEHITGGMDETAARDRASAEMRDNPKQDWRRG